MNVARGTRQLAFIKTPFCAPLAIVLLAYRSASFWYNLSQFIDLETM